MTLGMEFAAYATTLGEDMRRLSQARRLLLEINMGATAIGTGICAPVGYATLVTEALRAETGLPLMRSVNLVEATWDTGVYVQVSRGAQTHGHQGFQNLQRLAPVVLGAAHGP